MIDCNVFIVKADQETIESDQKSCFYIHIFKIIEKGHSNKLSSLFANFIKNSINDDE